MVQQFIFPDQAGAVIQPEIYGNFSEHLGRCIYDGFFVGKDSPIPNVNGMRTDVVEAFKRIGLPVLRWPGGCFADEYHWQQGIGPQENRKRMVNTNWGGVVEDNSFGTHEFMELCRQIGCKPYINGNVGSGTVQEMAEWIEYMTAGGDSTMAQQRAANGHAEPWKVDYFGVGNENWGCGGNMRPEYYADLFRRYQSYVKQYGPNKIYKIACGPGTSMEDPNWRWTEVLMANAAPYMDGISMHYYTVPGDWPHKGSATDFTEEEYRETLKKSLFIDDLVRGHGTIMDRYDPEKRIGLIVDEWGTWYDVEPGTNPGFLYQQNTMRDAMVAGMTLNIFNKHADRVKMANIAQAVNVLQAVVLTDGAQMVLTPTFYAFELYKAHQGARLLKSELIAGEKDGLPVAHESSSVQADGSITTTICNPSAGDALPMRTVIAGKHVSLRSADLLAGDIHAHNDFEEGNAVAIAPFEGIKVAYEGEDTVLTYTLPACALARIRVQ